MLLVIDCGNTNAVLALYDGQDLAAHWRVPSKPLPELDKLLATLRTHQAELQAENQKIDKVIIASVVPEAEGALIKFAKSVSADWQVIVSGKTPLGIEIDVQTPSEVGADRLVNAVAVAHAGILPAIVIDFGTATTFDVVLPDAGAHNISAIYAGGLIAPGINLSLQALGLAASKLPQIEIKSWPADLPIVGRDTYSAMQAGVLWGYVAMVEGIVERIMQEYDRSFELVLTGGLAPLFQPHLKYQTHHMPHLTLDGLAALAG